ncbi:cytochrome b5-like [Zingiber officinale]|uniref:Cytochrome b5 heme-binding domain-containing protein n=1 Tax=Zingiber officinale TaxID=94328 RepID=A0A8J5GZG3_ZINOF|nr:cytochrome b5-like [Zingiber officinale]KAG6510229.1 hypothetical protein ZIOFF_028238 [Zingiber officinale]
MGASRVFQLSQVAPHNTERDAWLVINGRVLDVTRFLEDHPGGSEVLMESVGKDATAGFDAVGHSKAAAEIMAKYQVGVLQGFEDKYSALDAKEKSEGKVYEMTGRVIKEAPGRKRLWLIDLFVPSAVAVLAFWYRCSGSLAEV